MTRHIIDQEPRTGNGGRLKPYVAIEREQGLHPATRELIRRPADSTGKNRRMKEFLRIERGHTE